MRAFSTLTVVALAGSTAAFAPPSAQLRPSSTSSRASLTMEYIPSGLSKEEWKKIKDTDKKKQENLGKMGVSRFKSRSFQAWQESGAGHLFPVDPKKVKNGEIPMDKVPYMQRGGAWDNSDLVTKKGKESMKKKTEKVVANNKVSKGVEKKAWSKTDKEYAAGGFMKEQSISIFGGAPLPWASGAAKSPGVEMDNKRRLGEQSKVKRAATNKPMSAAVKRRVEREAAEERKKQERLQKQLKSEKKGPFGLW